MGEASKIVSVVLRLWELICASVVTGIVGTYFHYVNNAHDGLSSRMAYAIATGSISIFFALAMMVPTKYSFWGFALDFAIFIMWMVVFGLLIDVSGSSFFDPRKLTDSAAHRKQCL